MRRSAVTLHAGLVLFGLLPACSSDDAPFTGEPSRLETSTGTLHGTLLAPAGDEPHPAVLILAGSGPTDRDGNSASLPGNNDSLRMLAERLAGSGIASVRYDKRGVGESAQALESEEALTLDVYVDDARAWLAQLEGDERFSSVSVVGHSEGSLIGMLTMANRTAGSFVSIAGPARRASDVLREQLEGQLSEDLMAENERILTALESGSRTTSIPPELEPLYRPSARPYLISWFQHVPSDDIRTLNVPVLIVQGTTDAQVGVEDAEALHAAKPDSELLVVDGMNHVLKQVSDDMQEQQDSYAKPALPIDEHLVRGVVGFIQGAAD